MRSQFEIPREYHGGEETNARKKVCNDLTFNEKKKKKSSGDSFANS